MSRRASTEDVKADQKQRATKCAWPLFTAISDVMMQAKKGRLEPEDLLSLPGSDNVYEQSELLKKSWERTLRHFHRDQAAKKAEELANPEAAAKKKKKKKGEELPSLTKAMWPQVRGLWRVAFGLYLVSVGLAFLGPFLLGRTVQLLQTTQQCGLREQQLAAVKLEDDGIPVSNDPPTISTACRESSQIHLGYIYAAAMLCVKLFEAMFRSWHDHLMTRLALRARAAIIATIYRKCLWLSGMGAGDTTTGRIQNLMANDAQFFLQIAPMFNNLFVAPLQAPAAPPAPFPPSQPARARYACVACSLPAALFLKLTLCCRGCADRGVLRLAGSAHRPELPRWRARTVPLRAVPGDGAQDLLQGTDGAPQGDRPARQAHQRDGAGHARCQDVRVGADHRQQARRGAREGATDRAQAALHVRLPLRLHDHAAPLPHRLHLFGLRSQRPAARGQHRAARTRAALAPADAHRLPAHDHHAAA